MHPGAAGCTGCIIAGPGRRCPAGTAAARDAPGLRIIGHVTRLTWQPAALVAPDASPRPGDGCSAAASSPVGHAARRRAAMPRTWRHASQSPAGGRSWPGHATRPRKSIPVITNPGAASKRPAPAEVFSVAGTLLSTSFMNGMPPHIAQLIAGHADINTTMGYKAVYPEEAITGHRAFLARRRALRPSEEYRLPTDEEWEEFLGHFARRKVALGDCGRAYGTSCVHEHSCIRCPLLRPDPPSGPGSSRSATTSRPASAKPARRLARRSRRPEGQPRRRPQQTRPARRSRQAALHHPPRHTRLPRHCQPRRHHPWPAAHMTAAPRRPS